MEKILDVGGRFRPYQGSTHCIDVIDKHPDDPRNFVVMDINNTPWPYKDKEFDYIYCSNVLEDIKDPIRVINEMLRVGKRGKIIVPSPFLECKKGVDVYPGKDTYAGYMHHRWIIFTEGDKLFFMQKTPMISVTDYIGDVKGPEFIHYEWEDFIFAKEMVYADYGLMDNYIKDWFKKYKEENK